MASLSLRLTSDLSKILVPTSVMPVVSISVMLPVAIHLGDSGANLGDSGANLIGD